MTKQDTDFFVSVSFCR